jgi:hypothetical protein
MHLAYPPESNQESYEHMYLPDEDIGMPAVTLILEGNLWVKTQETGHGCTPSLRTQSFLKENTNLPGVAHHFLSSCRDQGIV